MPMKIFVCHAYHPGQLPRDDQYLGEVHARDKHDALRLARKAWPGAPHICCQQPPVITASPRKIKPKPDYRMLARLKRGRA